MQIQEHRKELHAKSPHIFGIKPRSRYGESDEANAWTSALKMAQGRLHPTYLFDGRRILGLTRGFGPFSPHVAYTRFRHGTPWSEMERMRDDMLMMPFANYDGIINAASNGQFGRTYFAKTATTAPAANNWYDLWPTGGNPSDGSVANTAFTATAWTDASVGAINHQGNVSPATKHLLSKWAVNSTNVTMLMLYDRVISYDLNTFNASANQALTNTATAARYNTGAPGLLPCIFGCTVTGATAAALTQFQYTNQAGSALQSMPTTPTVNFIASAAAPTTSLGARCISPTSTGGTIPWGFSLPLASGDTGVRQATNYTTSAANTGTFSIVLMHPLTDLMMPVATIPVEGDCVFQISELERIYDGACLALMAFQGTTSGYQVTGGIKYAWST